MSLPTSQSTMVRKHRGSVRVSGRRYGRRSTIPGSLDYGKFRCQLPARSGSMSEKGNKKLSLADLVVSIDDHRRLMQTKISWDARHGDESMPEYGCFLYLIREVGNESENCFDRTCKTSELLCNSLCVTLCISVFLALLVAMVAIGVKYLEDCPKEPRIPVYLLVGGCFGIIKLLSLLRRNIQTRRYHDVIIDDPDADGAFSGSTYRTMDTLLFLFLFGWQISGTYWTFNIWTPHFVQLLYEPSNWCDKTVYMFTVYPLCTCYVVMAAFLLLLSVLMCFQKCCCRLTCRRLLHINMYIIWLDCLYSYLCLTFNYNYMYIPCGTDKLEFYIES